MALGYVATSLRPIGREHCPMGAASGRVQFWGPGVCFRRDDWPGSQLLDACCVDQRDRGADPALRHPRCRAAARVAGEVACVAGARRPAGLYAVLRRRPWALLIAGVFLGAGAWFVGKHNFQLFVPIVATLAVPGIATPRRVVTAAGLIAAVGLAAPQLTSGHGNFGGPIAVIVPPLLFWLIVDRIAGFALRLHQPVPPGITTTVDTTALNYRAVPVGPANAIQIQNTIDAYTDSGNYRASVDEGVAELTRVLNREAASFCAGTSHYVLVGYSQGAQVIGDLIDRNLVPTTFSRNIKSVVFFGDPKFTIGAHRVIARSSYDPATNGQLRPRALIAFDNLSSKTSLHSYCRERDPVCQAVASSDIEPHESYKDAESYWAAWNTANLLFPELANSNWKPTQSARLLTKAGKYYVRLSCRVPAEGVCHVRAKVAFNSTFGGTHHQTLRYVARAGKNGIVAATVPLSESDGRPPIRSAQADVTTTGISARYSEQNSALSIILR